MEFGGHKSLSGIMTLGPFFPLLFLFFFSRFSSWAIGADYEAITLFFLPSFSFPPFKTKTAGRRRSRGRQRPAGFLFPFFSFSCETLLMTRRKGSPAPRFLFFPPPLSLPPFEGDRRWDRGSRLFKLPPFGLIEGGEFLRCPFLPCFPVMVDGEVIFYRESFFSSSPPPSPLFLS